MLSFTFVVFSVLIYSIGLQRLEPVHTAYGATCVPIRKLLMHWHHSSCCTGQRRRDRGHKNMYSVRKWSTFDWRPGRQSFYFSVL